MLWLSAAQKALLDADSSVVMMKSISDSSRTFAVEGDGGMVWKECHGTTIRDGEIC